MRYAASPAAGPVCMALLASLVVTAGAFAANETVRPDHPTGTEQPAVVYEEQGLFPLVAEHVHGSTIVELPNGDLLVAWFQGSGERWADDVRIMGVRRKAGAAKWSEPFLMADTPGFPDINPILFMDGQDRLWLIWYTVIANQWETSLLKYRLSEDYASQAEAPRWTWQDVLHVKPGDSAERGIQPNDRFVKSVERQIEGYATYIREDLYASRPGEGLVAGGLWRAWGAKMLAKARGEDMLAKGVLREPSGETVDKQLGYPYFRRMGWQTKNKAVLIDGKRLIVPLYSDGFSFSLMAITDDGGRTWQFSEPLVGAGNIQPSIAQRADGTLVAFMRDNGPAPQRLHVSTSQDNGLTWSPVRDSDLPNPGSGADIVTLRNGHWALAYNDTEEGRESLAVSLSTDEGRTWSRTHHFIGGAPVGPRVSMAYPSIIQGADGTLHIVYSYHHSHSGKTIQYARLSESALGQIRDR